MLVTEHDHSTGRTLAQGTTVSRPFEWALGESINALAPGVKEHVLQSPGTIVVYRGRMRVWRDGGWRGKIAGGLMRIGILAALQRKSSPGSKSGGAAFQQDQTLPACGGSLRQT